LNNRKRFQYNVQLQKPSGEIANVPYSVLWDPEKVSALEVAQACAAEYSAGKAGPHAGLTAVLVTE
jgi:hypothetical protein